MEYQAIYGATFSACCDECKDTAIAMIFETIGNALRARFGEEVALSTTVAIREVPNGSA